MFNQRLIIECISLKLYQSIIEAKLIRTFYFYIFTIHFYYHKLEKDLSITNTLVNMTEDSLKNYLIVV